MEQFQERYTSLIKIIKGDTENVLSYNTSDWHDGMWRISAINDSMCSLGEVEGKIEVEHQDLSVLLDMFEVEIIKHNKGMTK